MNALAKPVLERSTCLFWVLSPEEQAMWKATTSEGRKAIEQEHRTRSGLDNMIGREQGPATAEQVAEAWAQARYWTEQLAEQEKAGPVPYYECDDDDDMRWLE
jgi:hypothetical protein